MVVVGDKEGGLGASHIYYRRPSHRPVVFRGSKGWEGGQIFLLISIGVFHSRLEVDRLLVISLR